MADDPRASRRRKPLTSSSSAKSSGRSLVTKMSSCLPKVATSTSSNESSNERNPLSKRNQVKNLLMKGNDLFHDFLTGMEEHKKRVSSLEKIHCQDFFSGTNDAGNAGQSEDDKTSTGHVAFSVKNKKSSRFDHQTLSFVVNTVTQNKLLDPLKSALLEWKSAMESTTCSSIDIKQFKLYDNVLTSFYVFLLHRKMDQALECASLLTSISKTTRDVKHRMNSCCLRIQVGLSIADYEWCNRIVTEFEGIQEEFERQVKSSSGIQQPSLLETFEGILFWLLRIDLDIRLNKGHLDVHHLKDILDSSYLKQATPNRYFLKTLGMMTTTKFPGDVYPHTSANLEEFTESVNMMYWMIRRWSRDILSSAENEPLDAKKTEVNDPVWLRFMTLNYFMEAHNTTSKFFINIGSPLDSEYYHNVLIKFARHYCSLFHLRQLLISAANVDRITDRNKDALIKVTTALDLFKKRRYNDITEPTARLTDEDHSDVEDFIKSNNDGLIEDDNEENCSSQANGCLHLQKEINVYQLKRQAMKKTVTNNDDDYEAIILNNKDYFGEKPEETDCFGADALKIEGLILLSLLKTKSCSNSDLRTRCQLLAKIPLTANIKSSLDIARQVLRDIPREVNSTSRASVSSIPSRNLILRDALENSRQLLTCRLRAMMACVFIQTFNQLDMKSKAMSVASQLLEMKFHHRVDCIEGYSSRVQFAEFLVLYSGMMMDTSKSRRLVYNAVDVEQSFGYPIESTSILVSTQVSPVKSKSSSSSYRKQFQEDFQAKLLRAPKTKGSLYEVEELKDYYKELAKVEAADPKSSNRRTRQAKEGKEIGRNESPVQKYRQFMESSTDFLSPMKSYKKSAAITQVEFEDEVTNKKTRPVLVHKTSTAKKSTTEAPVSQSLPVVQTILDVVESTNSNEDMLNVLQSVKRFLGNHPPVNLHKMIHHLISDYFLSCPDSSLEKSLPEQGDLKEGAFHLTETTAVAFRYFAIKTFSRRERKKTHIPFDQSLFQFSPKSHAYSDVIERAFSHLPTGSRILQIQCDYDSKPEYSTSKLPNLVLTRFEKGVDKFPVIIKIASDPRKHRKPFMEELSSIIESSNASIIEKEPQTFWSARKALDKNMSRLLQSVEHAWLGPWISFFLGKVTNDKFRSVVKTIAIELNKTGKEHGLVCRDIELLKVLCEGTPLLSKEQLFYGLSFLFDSSEKIFLECCLKKVHRLLDMIVSPNSKLSEDTRYAEIYSLLTPMPVALIVGHSLELFPWESLPSLAEQSYFRIPNLRFLAASLEVFANDQPVSSSDSSKSSTCDVNRLALGEDPESVFYLLNPTDNLFKTEERFKDRFESMKGWSGYSGSCPDGVVLKELFEEKDVYIFFGHGSGSSFYRRIPDNLEGTSLHSSSLVIGCSSGRLASEGESLEATGVAYRFLLNGSPSFLGVLWDVTDGDIDTFADNVLQEWMTTHVWTAKDSSLRQIVAQRKGPPLTNAATTARSSCRLRCLIGAAPVVYGLPISVRIQK